MPEVVERSAEAPANQRAIHLVPYLNRMLPFWGHPNYLSGERWRATVANQPIAQICRDTLISNTLSMEWAIRKRESTDTMLQIELDEIDHYTEVITEAEDGFENLVSLVAQDMLDLPFGGIVELGRLKDEPEGPVMWIQHIDGATMVPTQNYDWPVMQQVPNAPGKPVVFPRHTISRAYWSPRPEILRKGWGMAPPEKIYLALAMLFRGDRYYANLLLDTPSAGILDLADMDEESATQWLESWENLSAGADPLKVPVLYGHTQPAQFIPFGRPPEELIFSEVTLKYAALVAAGYGIQLSDIGLAESSGEKTLAGVIRGERQTRRTGRGEIRRRIQSFFNKMLPKHLMFIFEEKDEEAKTEQARALSTYGMALGQLRRDGLISPEEARVELVATGLLETEIDPQKVPEPPPQPSFGGGFGGFGQPGGGKPFGKPDEEKVTPEQGGRGEVTIKTLVTTPPKIPGETAHDELSRQLSKLIAPSLGSITTLAERAGGRAYRASSPGNPIPSAPRIRRLIKATVKAMLPSVKRSFDVLDDEAIQRTWLPQMLAMDFDLPSELDGIITRQDAEEINEALEKLLIQDQWWKVASAWDKDTILQIFKSAYEVGLEEMAIGLVRSLYQEALANSPELSVGIRFNLTNRRTLNLLERSAADLVTNVNDGTKYFLKRVVVAGVRDGMARPEIAAAIRDGVKAEVLLRNEGFVSEAIQEILSGLSEMSEARSESIVLTEINKATNMGNLDQMKESGLKQKAWVHLGPRGLTDKGNEHPCEICAGNEELGFVDADFVFETVFGGDIVPPAHPNVCHCRVIFDEQELMEAVAEGAYTPYLGE